MTAWEGAGGLAACANALLAWKHGYGTIQPCCELFHQLPSGHAPTQPAKSGSLSEHSRLLSLQCNPTFLLGRHAPLFGPVVHFQCIVQSKAARNGRF